MSYVTIYRVEANGNVIEEGEGSNNHTFAPLIWQILGYKHGYMNKALHPYSLMDPGLMVMFKDWPSPKMSRLEQILLGSTFDFVWVKRDLLPELIEACEWFLNEHVLKVNDWRTGAPAQATYDNRTLQGDGTDSIHKREGIIACLKRIYEDPTTLGAAFNCCSAVQSFWNVYDVEPGPDDYPDPCEKCSVVGTHSKECSYFEWDPRPYNVLKDSKQPRGEYMDKAAWELLGVLDEVGV